jgi:hypothetical protein
MRFKTKEQFISGYGIRKLGLVEYIKSLENEGLEDIKIQSTLIENRVVKSPRMLDRNWKFYLSIRNQIAWI